MQSQKIKHKSFSSAKVITLYVLFVFSGSKCYSQIKELAKKGIESTVSIITYDKDRNPLKAGSGFYFEDGRIATNFHVLQGSSYIKIITFEDSTEFSEVPLLSFDEVNDIAIIKTNLKLPRLTLSNDSTIDIGETIYIVGNPEGFRGTFSDGIISGKRHIKGRNLIQVTAPVSKGSSGGPALKENGNVIGIVVSSFSDAQNINFIIPIHLLKNLNENNTYVTQVNTLNNLADSFYKSAETYFNNREYSQALIYCNKSIALNSSLDKSYLLRAKINYCMNNFKLIYKDLCKTISINPNNSEAYYWRGLLSINKNSSKEYFENVEIYVDTILKYYNVQEISFWDTIPFSDYLPDTLKIIAADELAIAQMQYLDKMGLELSESQHTAISDFDSCIYLDPSNLKARYRKAKLLDFDDNIHELELIIDSKFASSDLLYAAYVDLSEHMFTKYYENKESNSKLYTKCMEYINRAIDLKPKLFYAHYRKASFKSGFGDYLGSIKCLTDCIKLNPSHCYIYYFERAQNKFQCRDYKGAGIDFEMAISLNPTIYYCKAYAEMLLDIKKYNLAIDIYNRAINLVDKITPDQKWLINSQIAELYKGRGIAKIMIKDINGGCLDFSKFSEFQNYILIQDLIRKYCN